MSKAVTFGLGAVGVAVVGVGLAIVRQKAEAEKKVTELAPNAPRGTVQTPNVPTHTSQPHEEQKHSTLMQLLSSYRSDLARLQSERMVVETELRQLEAAGETACRAYATDPKHEELCSGLFCLHKWWAITGKQTNDAALGLCKNAVKGFGTLQERNLELKNADYRKEWEALVEEMRQGMRQALDISSKYQRAKQRLTEIDNDIADLQKKINDLNAKGVY